MDPVLNKALKKLSERAKELECIHNVEYAIKNSNNSEDKLFKQLVEIIPRGMQYPTICEVQISYGDNTYESDEYSDSQWMIKSDLMVDNNPVGHIKVVYTQSISPENGKQFLPDEQKLLENLTSRISCWLFVLMIKSSKKHLP
jgi:two-component system, NtrC family, sensor kinase